MHIVSACGEIQSLTGLSCLVTVATLCLDNPSLTQSLNANLKNNPCDVKAAQNDLVLQKCPHEHVFKFKTKRTRNSHTLSYSHSLHATRFVLTPLTSLGTQISLLITTADRFKTQTSFSRFLSSFSYYPESQCSAISPLVIIGN